MMKPRKRLPPLMKLIIRPTNEGGCMQSVMLLKNKGVNSIITIGVGQRPLMGFLQQGIKVVKGVSATAREISNNS